MTAAIDDAELVRQDTIRARNLDGRVNALLMSPVFGELDPAELAQWILEDHIPVRLQIQIHKHIWPPNTRGV